jgi:radical SAM-linked protein
MGNGQEAPVRAYRLRFRKSGLARFLSHRDLMRVFRRALRRAECPLSLTRGFNPHPRIRIRPASALGVVLLSAVLEIVLEDEWNPEKLVESLSSTLPPGLRILEARLLPSVRAAPVTAMTWRFLRVPEPAEFGEIDMPEGMAIEREDEQAVRITVRGAPGTDPPGARALAALLAPEEAERSFMKVELVSIQFEDGI